MAKYLDTNKHRNKILHNISLVDIKDVPDPDQIGAGDNLGGPGFNQK